ncbi:Plant non-specific lipid-transfer protein/Par allergen protein [Dioscorea alata]|uniref:Plant non-specific lipid-transfer protein/Par allergen protein n=1 Tax=Dioscorea alata TaxID=55571 RepID=A0ACB7ULV7_DIOAL|nr:Plant non-specific lipid-transfer protein/Par allergen protein [Dioscorea alata]
MTTLLSITMMIMAMVIAPTVSGQQNCIPAITSLSPCLGFISGNTTTTTAPSPMCCSQLASVISSQAQCLCSVVNGGGAAAQLGLVLNQTQALALPGACNLKIPPLSQCNVAAGAPAGSPVISPVGAPAASVPPVTPSVSNNKSPAAQSVPSPVPTSAGGGSKSVPSTKSQSSDGVLQRSANYNLVVLLAFACFAIKF